MDLFHNEIRVLGQRNETQQTKAHAEKLFHDSWNFQSYKLAPNLFYIGAINIGAIHSGVYMAPW